MTGLILDLEWNGAPRAETGVYYNEIIEIGAVKVDDAMRITGEFHAVVRPTVNRRLTHIVKKLTSITQRELAEGERFVDALNRLTAFAGEQPVALLTWSNTDLSVLMENLAASELGERIPFASYYADVQPYCQQKLGLSAAQQVSLEKACEAGEIPPAEWHRALDDSRQTALLLQKVFDPRDFAAVLRPTDEEFYARLTFKAHFLTDPNDPQIDKKAFAFRCPDCNRPLRQKTRFKRVHRAFCSDMICGMCGKEFTARVQCRQLYDRLDVRRRLSEKKPKAEETEAAPCEEKSSAR